jgi:hypothetical protein
LLTPSSSQGLMNMSDLIRSDFLVRLSDKKMIRLFLWIICWLLAHKVSFWIIHSYTLTKFQFFFPLRCPLKTLFGIHCPTCGLGESILYFLAFDFVSSSKAHILGPVALTFFFVFSLIVALYPNLVSKFVK